MFTQDYHIYEIVRYSRLSYTHTRLSNTHMRLSDTQIKLSDTHTKGFCSSSVA